MMIFIVVTALKESIQETKSIIFQNQKITSGSTQHVADLVDDLYKQIISAVPQSQA